MPKDKSGKYASTADLPDAVKNALPAHGQAIFRAAYNSAVDEGKDEQTCYQIAWAAVSKGGYRKGSDGKWTRPADWKPKSDAETGPWEREMAVLQDAFARRHPFGETTVRVDIGDEMLQLECLVAESIEQRALGMTGRTFDGFDAMLFIEPCETLGAFHMNGVDIALLIAFFDEDGELVDQVVLQPGQGPYRATRPFRYVLEVAADLELGEEPVLLLSDDEDALV